MAYFETDQRFRAEPTVVGGNYTTDTTSSTTAKTVTGSTVNFLPGQVQPGLWLRYKCSGTKTATNAAHTLKLYINNTLVQTLTADDATAVDWVAEFNLVFTGPATQRCYGTMLSDTADPEVEYDTGTVNTTSETKVYLVATAGNASDTVTVNMLSIEQLQL